MKLNYLLLDVFTTEPLAGNQLAVVLKGDGLLDNQMQAIAQEFGLSETVFLTRPRHERSTSGVRIFTPEMELPFAGHPTVGAAVVVALHQRLTAVRLEELVGTITCIVDRVDKRTAHARFSLPQLPEEVGRPPDRNAIALALGTTPDEIGCGPYHPAVFSAGVLYYLVPLRNSLTLKRLKPNLGLWHDTFPLGNHGVYCFTETPEEKGADFAARMFRPGSEDAGTGAAAAALIGLLARHTSFDDGQAELQIRQGWEMGRPCRISVQLRKEAGRLSHGGIGGHAVIVGEGALDLQE